MSQSFKSLKNQTFSLYIQMGLHRAFLDGTGQTPPPQCVPVPSCLSHLSPHLTLVDTHICSPGVQGNQVEGLEPAGVESPELPHEFPPVPLEGGLPGPGPWKGPSQLHACCQKSARAGMSHATRWGCSCWRFHKTEPPPGGPHL